MAPGPESPAGEPPSWWNVPEAFAGAKAAGRVHRERLGLCWASCFPNFRTCLCILATGERAAAFESLRPVREAGEGGQDFQEALLQGGSEESLDHPHAALPGPLLRCSPGQTHPPRCVPKCGDPWPPKENVRGGLSPASLHQPLSSCQAGEGPFR